MKKLILILTLLNFACALPIQLTSGTPTETPAPTQTLEPTQTPRATGELGTDKNPLILALGASPRLSAAVNDAGATLAAQLSKLTGYKIVVVAPTSEKNLIEALDKGNAHIASLSPYAYLQAYQNGSVTASLASVRNGQTLYGAQFIAHRDSKFQSYYDEIRGENTANADTALSQFKDRKPCWSDNASASGYVTPLGFLNQAKVPVGNGAFLEGQTSVVRALYATGICDFGATFIDARQSPALEANYPDVMEKVIVVWRIPPIIPYENISFSTTLPVEMRRVLLRAFSDAMLTPEGKSAVQTIYGIESLQPTDDALYAEFQKVVKSSGLDLGTLLDIP